MKKRTFVLGLAALLALAMVFTGCDSSSSTTNTYPGVTGDNLGPVVATLTAAKDAFAKGYTTVLLSGDVTIGTSGEVPSFTVPAGKELVVTSYDDLARSIAPGDKGKITVAAGGTLVVAGSTAGGAGKLTFIRPSGDAAFKPFVVGTVDAALDGSGRLEIVATGTDSYSITIAGSGAITGGGSGGGTIGGVAISSGTFAGGIETVNTGITEALGNANAEAAKVTGTASAIAHASNVNAAITLTPSSALTGTPTITVTGYKVGSSPKEVGALPTLDTTGATLTVPVKDLVDAAATDDIEITFTLKLSANTAISSDEKTITIAAGEFTVEQEDIVALRAAKGKLKSALVSTNGSASAVAVNIAATPVVGFTGITFNDTSNQATASSWEADTLSGIALSVSSDALQVADGSHASTTETTVTATFTDVTMNKNDFRYTVAGDISVAMATKRLAQTLLSAGSWGTVGDATITGLTGKFFVVYGAGKAKVVTTSGALGATEYDLATTAGIDNLAAASNYGTLSAGAITGLSNGVTYNVIKVEAPVSGGTYTNIAANKFNTLLDLSGFVDGNTLTLANGSGSGAYGLTLYTGIENKRTVIAQSNIAADQTFGGLTTSYFAIGGSITNSGNAQITTEADSKLVNVDMKADDSGVAGIVLTKLPAFTGLGTGTWKSVANATTTPNDFTYTNGSGKLVYVATGGSSSTTAYVDVTKQAALHALLTGTGGLTNDDEITIGSGGVTEILVGAAESFAGAESLFASTLKVTGAAAADLAFGNYTGTLTIAGGFVSAGTITGNVVIGSGSAAFTGKVTVTGATGITFATTVTPAITNVAFTGGPITAATALVVTSGAITGGEVTAADLVATHSTAASVASTVINPLLGLTDDVKVVLTGATPALNGVAVPEGTTLQLKTATTALTDSQTVTIEAGGTLVLSDSGTLTGVHTSFGLGTYTATKGAVDFDAKNGGDTITVAQGGAGDAGDTYLSIGGLKLGNNAADTAAVFTFNATADTSKVLVTLDAANSAVVVPSATTDSGTGGIFTTTTAPWIDLTSGSIKAQQGGSTLTTSGSAKLVFAAGTLLAGYSGTATNTDVALADTNNFHGSDMEASGDKITSFLGTKITSGVATTASKTIYAIKDADSGATYSVIDKNTAYTTD